jgi:hypothetical protein
MQENILNIEIAPEKLEAFCQQLLARSRDITKTHDALVTLDTFIKVFSGKQQGSAGCNAVEAVLVRMTEASRQQLLQQKTRELLQAMQQQNVAAVTAIHTPMSRNGFYQILQIATAQLSAEELHPVRDWAVAWTAAAKHKADKLSQYPDAPDFKAAGIMLEEFMAMQDIGRYLESLKQG